LLKVKQLSAEKQIEYWDTDIRRVKVLGNKLVDKRKLAEVLNRTRVGIVSFYLPCPGCQRKQTLYYAYRLGKFVCENKGSCNLSILYSVKGLARLETKYKTLFAKQNKETLTKINRQI
ncbi:15444_t:CDS:2, partial [Racocetra fulgida]